MKNEINNIDTEFTDINKENNNKNYIIVVILYVIVIILSIFLILGIKNQKNIVKDNIDSEEKIEDNLNKNDNTLQEKQQQKDSGTKDSNNLFDDVRSDVDEFNTIENEKLNDGMSLLDQIG